MKRELSYQFDLDIERVYLLINMKCDVQVWWKSGKGKIATKNSIKLNGSEKFFDIRQKLSIIAKIVLENGVLRQKKTELLIILFTSENTSKLGGRVYLNLSELISPQNLTVSVSKRFEKSLENCPDETSKIFFNLSCKYIEENMTTGSQNIQDISFQANTFTTNSFGGKIADMTFRPEKEPSYRRQSTPYLQEQSIKSNEFLSKQKVKQEHDKEKQDTPSWDKSFREKQMPDVNYTAMNSNRARQKQPERSAQISNQNIQKPMEFSFNPLSSVQRQKLGFDNSQIIRELKQIAQQRGKTIKTLQDQLSRLRNEVEQKSEKLSSKSISLINELNLATNLKDQLQRQKSQILSEMESLKQENRRLQQKSKMMHLQFSDANTEYISKLQQRKKTIEELSIKLEDSERRTNRLQDELFRKQNEIITKEKEFISSNMSRENLTKEQSEKLKSISYALKELQGNFQKLYEQKQEIRRKNEEYLYNLEKSDEVNKRMSQNMMKLEQQLIKEKQKSKLVEGKFMQRQSIIQEIENQFNIFSQQKNQVVKQKEDQLAGLREKLLGLTKRLEQVSGEQSSMKNTISEKNIRIKSLENICEQQEKGLEEKQELITKAKQYFSLKDKELEEKKAEILKKDEFIQKCRAYIQTKQAQYAQVLNEAKNTTQGEIGKLRTDLKAKQEMLQRYINEAHRAEKQIQDMEIVIENTKSRIMDLEDYIEQLQRKIESQQDTLKDLVKKNLDMQIQLNIKDYEIQSLRSTK